MATRTQHEINVQIKALQLERASLPERSRFGNNNWKMIDHKIEILQGKFEYDLTSEEAEEEFDEEDLSELQLTEDWLNGTDCDAPCGDEELIARAEAQLAN